MKIDWNDSGLLEIYVDNSKVITIGNGFNSTNLFTQNGTTLNINY